MDDASKHTLCSLHTLATERLVMNVMLQRHKGNIVFLLGDFTLTLWMTTQAEQHTNKADCESANLEASFNNVKGEAVNTRVRATFSLKNLGGFKISVCSHSPLPLLLLFVLGTKLKTFGRLACWLIMEDGGIPQ